MSKQFLRPGQPLPQLQYSIYACCRQENIHKCNTGKKLNVLKTVKKKSPFVEYSAGYRNIHWKFNGTYSFFFYFNYYKLRGIVSDNFHGNFCESLFLQFPSVSYHWKLNKLFQECLPRKQPINNSTFFHKMFCHHRGYKV